MFLSKNTIRIFSNFCCFDFPMYSYCTMWFTYANIFKMVENFGVSEEENICDLISNSYIALSVYCSFKILFMLQYQVFRIMMLLFNVMSQAWICNSHVWMSTWNAHRNIDTDTSQIKSAICRMILTISFIILLNKFRLTGYI